MNYANSGDRRRFAGGQLHSSGALGSTNSWSISPTTVRTVWNVAVSKDYSLIILDLTGFQGMTGQEVLDGIRKINRTVPVLILTARGTIQDKVELFQKGCDDYLTKPFAFAELQARQERVGPSPQHGNRRHSLAWRIFALTSTSARLL